jgi:hypothetical protein
MAMGALTAGVINPSLDGLDDLEDDAGAIVKICPAIFVPAGAYSWRKEL